MSDPSATASEHHARKPFSFPQYDKEDEHLIERLPGESLDAWRIRLMLMKVNKEIDLDWIEIRDLCEMDCSPDQLRKMAQGVRMACSVIDAQGGPVTSQMTNPAATVPDRYIRQAQSIPQGDLYRPLGRQAALRERIMAAIQPLPAVEVPAQALHDPQERRELVVAVADCHYGAEIHVQGLHGEVINHYDPEVFEQRMWRLRDEIIRIVEREDISLLHIAMLGDSLDGMLRASQLMQLRYGMVESCMRFSDFMAVWLRELARFVPIHVYTVDGNHTEIRPLGTKRNMFPEENLEKVITWALQARLRDCPQIQIAANEGKHKLAQVCGYNLLLTHGDGDKGLNEAAKSAMLLYQTPIHYMMTAHLHSAREASYGLAEHGNAMILRAPAICGTDSYAMSLKHAGWPGTIAAVFSPSAGLEQQYYVRL